MNQEDNQINKSVQVKVTRLDENFLSDLKRKRKLSSDSLESLNEELEKTSCSLQNVEQILNETGLNVQLIAKNDKKLIKLNLNTKNQSITGTTNLIESIDKLKQIKSIINSENLPITNKFTTTNRTVNLNDIDDLPSESDVSSGVVLIPINNAIQHHSKPILDSINQTSSVTLYFKCNKCNKIFNDDSMFKFHQEIQECTNSESENEFEKLLLNDSQDEFSINKNNDQEKFNNQVNQKVNRKKIFICNECGIQFNLQSDLNKHMQQTHDNVKPYKCSLCNQSFYELSSKNRHEKEHSGLKPFRCYICSFEFTRASNLRTHLLKVHPNDVGKLVNITKSTDNKLKFEFDIEAINFQREQTKQIKLNQYSSSSSLSKSNSSSYSSLNSDSSNHSVVNNNTVIYIKDPNNKNADIQHMVVYVDGKPIFVQNPQINNSDVSKDQQKNSFKPNLRQTKSKNSSSTSNLNKPVAKIPYLLAAAAAAAASNHRKQQLLNQQVQQSQPKIQVENSIRIVQSSNDSIRTMGCSYETSSSTNKIKDLKHDQEYMQLVSMFKQKNEKLYNPLKSF